MSNTQTEAQRLADWADDRAFSDAAYCNSEYNAIADELRRLDALCDERGTNEARMLMRLTEMQKQVDQLQAEAGQFKALAKANADALGASLSERDQLREALQKILNWNSHTTNYAVHVGSNGVRDFYREIARQALATTEPVMANGLTEAETDASASVVGLATTAPEPTGMPPAPEPDIHYIYIGLGWKPATAQQYAETHRQKCAMHSTIQLQTYGEQCWKAGYKHGAWG